jgi:membrane protease YdiL (CAAX protease family)
VNVPTAVTFGLRFLFAWAVLAIVPTLLWDLGSRNGWIDVADRGPMFVEASALVAGAAFLLVAIAARWLPPAPPWRPAFAAAMARTYVPFLLAWIAVCVGYLTLMRAIGQPVPAQPQLTYLANGDIARPGFWWVFATVVILAPLAEEIAFRGYLQPALTPRFGSNGALLATAAAFGLMHGLAYALPVALLGGLFGWLLVRRGSLLPSILAHMLHNAITVIVTVAWPASLDLLYPTSPR